VCFDDPLETPVVRTEVVAPVRDAVRLIDDEEPEPVQQVRENVASKLGVVEPFGRYQKQVDLIVVDGGEHVDPVVTVRRIDGLSCQIEAGCSFDLVAHQGEQRRDDDGRSRTSSSQDLGGDEVHR